MKRGKKKIRIFMIGMLLCWFLLFVIADCDSGKNNSLQQDVGNEVQKNVVAGDIFWVNAEDGLVLRRGPGTGKEKTGVIPYGDRVKLLEEQGEVLTIQGRKGKWSKVEWSDKSGWVFGGFLSEQEIEKINVNFIGGWEPHMVGEAFYFFDEYRCAYDRIGTEGGGSGTYSYDPGTGTVVMQIESEAPGGSYSFSKTIKINWVDKTTINITSFDEDGREFTHILYKTNSLLHEAAAKEDIAEIDRLLRDGWDIELRIVREKTPLHTAASKNKIKSLIHLLDNTADIEAKDFNGWTPLHHAALSFKVESVELLLQRGADVNARGNKGKTALHLIAERYPDNAEKQDKCITLLLDNGADITLQDYANNNTPYDSLIFRKKLLKDIYEHEKAEACDKLLQVLKIK
ncbi:MAG: ankyrin repeat domain-containing protein [Spirochaetales bacterium]|nr:ankyrin repeat domain-containing protein [Spirochaetales bacterium]